ncbi:MAG TPA: hypothetical protein PKD64_10240 [Pirellulaceae bacterium]|nr:hypothetical protein [Pirellulaceae bacterium]HMO92560.1 hypothetical protein [Pirellulaceae bacterium]HMP70642.1 hypothetical protein [Pirellulaceae bacterium]
MTIAKLSKFKLLPFSLLTPVSLILVAIVAATGCQMVHLICGSHRCGTVDVAYQAQPNHSLLSLARSQSPETSSQFGWIWPNSGDEPVPYIPSEGDIVLMSSFSPVYSLLFSLGGTGHPLHAAMVVKNSRGELDLFEVGVLDRRRVTLSPLAQRFHDYYRERTSATIWIRSLRVPLCEERSRALTAFAESQHGKSFSYIRSASAAITGNIGIPSTPQQGQWFCSELVVQALKEANLIDEQARPEGMVPSDFYYNMKIDLNPLWLPAASWTIDPTPDNDRPYLAPRVAR